MAIARHHQAVSDELASWLIMQDWLQKSEIESIDDSAAPLCSIEDVRQTIEKLRGQMEVVNFDIPTLKILSDGKTETD